jgi:serine protease AprX
MKKIVRKKITPILLCAFMLVSVDSHAFTDDTELMTEEAITEVEETTKMFDENGDKIFENLADKIKDIMEDEKVTVTVVFKDKYETVKQQVVELLGDFDTKYEFNNIPAATMKLSKKQIYLLSKLDMVQQIEYDEEVKAFMDTSRYWFGTAKACTDFGLDGDRDGNINTYSKDDVVIAVIDTGIDEIHIDLDGKVIGWKDYINNDTSPYDDNGHGTHVSGIIAGEGQGNSMYEGVAKGAALVGLKVLDSRGSGSMSDVTAAIDWCVTNKDTYGIDIINMSLGTSGSSDGTDSASLAVNNANENGIIVAVAAGNSGPKKYSIGSPGAAKGALTVGSMVDIGEGGFQLASYSSRGYTADSRIKPDICAPGTKITAAKADSVNGYTTLSGTSMATPFAAGTIALMLDANPSLLPSQIKDILKDTAQDWGIQGKDPEYGYGKLDGYKAIKEAGNYSGDNISLPNHLYGIEELTGKLKKDEWEFNINDTNYPIAITFIMPDWDRNLRLNIFLFDPDGNLVDQSILNRRQKNISFTPTSTGTYKLRVRALENNRYGTYYFDISAGGDSLTRTQDDVFGIQE